LTSPTAVQSLEVSYFLQATEDEEKVRRAVTALIGGDVPTERQEAEGHHGNMIVWVRHHLTGGEAEDAFREIMAHLDEEEKGIILRDLDATLDEHNALYIRLSKQALVLRGAALLTSSDPIRLKVKPRAYLVKGDPAAFYAKLLERI
jgi:RNA binding exosome subunit